MMDPTHLRLATLSYGPSLTNTPHTSYGAIVAQWVLPGNSGVQSCAIVELRL